MCRVLLHATSTMHLPTPRMLPCCQHRGTCFNIHIALETHRLETFSVQ